MAVIYHARMERGVPYKDIASGPPRIPTTSPQDTVEGLLNQFGPKADVGFGLLDLQFRPKCHWSFQKRVPPEGYWTKDGLWKARVKYKEQIKMLEDRIKELEAQQRRGE